jgi:hypothetical protein
VFLRRGSLAAGAAATLAAVPGIGSLLAAGGADTSEIGGEAGEAGTAGTAVLSSSQPLIAHVVDAGTGEINLYQGTEQIVTRDPQLAQALLRAARS